jgi:hypothetical protein
MLKILERSKVYPWKSDMRVSTKVVVNVQLYMIFGGYCGRFGTCQSLATLTVRDMWSVIASIDWIATLLSH